MNVYELEQTLRANNIHPEAVRFGSGLPDADEQYCIAREGSRWEVYYAERGQKSNVKIFDSEDAACSYLLSILKQDASVWFKR
jgi:hypothetical protein